MRNLPLFLLCSISCLLSCQQAQDQALLDLTSEQAIGKITSGTGNIVFQSTDGGHTWQDISAGLPEGLRPRTFFASEGELILSTDKGIYKNSTASNTPHWEKEMPMEQQLMNMSAGPDGVIAVSNNSHFLQNSNSQFFQNNNSQYFQKLKGTGQWMPIFTDLKTLTVRNVFTSKDGSIFIGSDIGIFKSADQGKTWKHVMQDGWGIQMVESDGVLLCTNIKGILRSTDGGEDWENVVSEGGNGIAVEAIKGGFAVIVYNAESETVRIRTSTDGGKTWQPIDAGLPPSKLISSIKQVGETFYCGHPKGIYRSDDQGKSWQLLLPTIGKKVFNLSISGSVVYAVLQEVGC